MFKLYIKMQLNQYWPVIYDFVNLLSQQNGKTNDTAMCHLGWTLAIQGHNYEILKVP